MQRRTVESGTEWEEVVGYSRAVRVGSHVSVSGTTATDENGAVVDGSAREQTARALSNIECALGETGGDLTDVVRTRIYVTDIDDWEQVASAHEATFGDVRPATTIIEVSRLIAPELVVEIEADAIIDDGTGSVGTVDTGTTAERSQEIGPDADGG